MTGGELGRRVVGRRVQPYAFAVSLATAVVSAAVLVDAAVGLLLDTWPGELLGVLGVGTVVCLWWGWWAQSEVWLRRGLLWSAGVWSGVGLVLAVEGGAWVSALLAWCWAVASAGAWLLEVDVGPGRDG